MKKVILLPLIVLPLLIFGILILKGETTTPQKSGAQNLGTPPAVLSDSIDIDNFSVSVFEITNIDSLKLVPNFKEKLLSDEVINKNNCKFLSNGPFYSKEGKPLGLFISDGKYLAYWQNNSLFDGILSINDMATPRITRDIPRDNLRIAIQTGPIIKENNSYQSLKIQDDTGARRVVAAISGENKLYFLVFYDANNQFSGPFLADLPLVLKDFERKSGYTFADAVNLDGGAASTFNSPQVSLSEINPPGAFFCQP